MDTRVSPAKLRARVPLTLCDSLTNAQEDQHKLDVERNRLLVQLQDSAKESARLQTQSVWQHISLAALADHLDRLELSLSALDTESKKRSNLEQELRALQSQLDGERQRCVHRHNQSTALNA